MTYDGIYCGGMIQDLTQKLKDGFSMSDKEAELSVSLLVDAEIDPTGKADFLGALSEKGESESEITVIASKLRDMAVAPPGIESLDRQEIIDVCGTGGDHLNTFNVSTTVALLLAAQGIKVAKHGNRAITSKSGSADVLTALGLPVDLSPKQAVCSLRDNNFAFFFAIHYHPAFKHIGPARQICAQRGQRTIFNFLGPLLNPVKPACQLIGVPLPSKCEMIAKVLMSMGSRRGMVVSGRADDERYMDELSTLGNSVIAEFYQGRGFSVSELEIEHLPLSPSSIEDLKGGQADENAALIEKIISGEVKGPQRDIVLLNTAAALLVADRSNSIAEGWDLAAEIIDSGRAKDFLVKLRTWEPS